MDRVVNWARSLYQSESFWGKIIYLSYEICVNAYFQGAVHLIASCMLGAFAYREQTFNWPFVIPFGLIYLLFLAVFSLCNVHRKNRNALLERYEYAYPKIAESFLIEYQSNLDLYNTGSNLQLEQLLSKYEETDFFTKTCFRICNAINDVLQKETDNKYRTTIFLRTNMGQDEYRISAFSPLSSEPEMYRSTFVLSDYKNVKKKKIPAHARPFLNNRCEPLIIIGAREVSKAYHDFHDSNPTKLHIGIPITINGMITMVLQITSHEECTGTENGIRDLIENVLNIFIAYLKVAYTHQMRLEQFVIASNNK